MLNRVAEMIQPVSLRSPEVIIGAEWDTKTDIWNVGCLVSELFFGFHSDARDLTEFDINPDIRICTRI
jgi:hypothetical protein